MFKQLVKRVVLSYGETQQVLLLKMIFAPINLITQPKSNSAVQLFTTASKTLTTGYTQMPH
jgi:hypothetical protein